MLPSLIGLVLRIIPYHSLDLRLVNMYLPYLIYWQGVRYRGSRPKSKKSLLSIHLYQQREDFIRNDQSCDHSS